MVLQASHIDDAADLLLLGGGPAALALAAEAQRFGLRVAIIDDAPLDGFSASFGLFVDELPDHLRAAVDAQWGGVDFRSERGSRAVDRPYARLHSDMLRQVMVQACDSCRMVSGRVVGVERCDDGFAVQLSDDRVLHAPRVVDCTGHRRVLTGGAGARRFQIALGGTLNTHHGLTRPLLMDFSGPARGTFLYALPMSDTELFVEETALITSAAPDWNELERRLRARLDGMGLTGPLDLHERCVIPMDPTLPDFDSPVLAFGAAAAMVHPATGYQLAASLALAPDLARALAETLNDSPESAAQAGWSVLWPSERRRVRELRLFGARFVADLDHRTQADFFDAFFQLPPELVRAYLAHDASMAATRDAMLRLFAQLPSALRWALVRRGIASPLPLLRPLIAA